MYGLDILAELSRIANDRVSGASKLFDETCRALGLWAEECIKSRTLNEEALRSVLKALTNVHPTMAPIRTLTILVGEIVESHESLDCKFRRLSSLARVLRAYRAECLRLIAERFREVVEGRVKVFTLSFSSVVYNTLRSCKNLVDEVLIVESRPGGEGLRLAEELANLGFRVHVAHDSCIPRVVGKADLTLLGADALLPDGSFVNKVGSLATAMACREYSVELVVAVEPYKIAQWAKGVEDIEVERWNLDELKVHENVEVESKVFEEVPSKYVDTYIIGGRVVKDRRMIPEVYKEVVEEIAEKTCENLKRRA